MTKARGTAPKSKDAIEIVQQEVVTKIIDTQLEISKKEFLLANEQITEDLGSKV